MNETLGLVPDEPDATSLVPDGEGETPVARSPLRERNAALELAAAGQGDPNDIFEQLRQKDFSSIARAKQQLTESFTDSVVQATTERKDPLAEAQRMADYAKQINDALQNPHYSTEETFTVGKPGYNQELVRFVINTRRAEEMLEQRMRDEWAKTSNVSMVASFIDNTIIRGLSLGAVELGTLRTEREQEDLVALKRLPAADFEKAYEKKLDEYVAEGVFTDGGVFSLAKAQKAAEGTAAPGSAVDLALAGVDIATLFSGSIARVARTSAGVLARTAAHGSVDEATAAAKAISKTPTGADAEVLVGSANSAADVTVRSRLLPKADPDYAPGGPKYTDSTGRFIGPPQAPTGTSTRTVTTERGASKVTTVVETGAPPRPNAAQSSANAYQRTLIPEVTAASRSGAFGRRLTVTELDNVVARISNDINTKVGRTNSDVRVVEGDLGNSTLVADFGVPPSGKPYSSREWAEHTQRDFTEKGVVSQVRQVDPVDPDKGFWVTVSEPIDTTKIAHDLELHSLDFVRKIYGRLLGGARPNDDRRLFNLANMADSGFSVLKKIAKAEIRTFDKLPIDAKRAIDEIFRELRDGQEAARRTVYDDLTFSQKFRARTGRGAEPADIEGYHAMVTIADTAYIMKANPIIKQHIALGYKALDGIPGDVYDVSGNPAVVVARRVSKGQVPDGSRVRNAQTNQPVITEDIPDEIAIWRTPEGDHWIKPKAVGQVEAHHVLGYNAGGPRLNPEGRWIVTLGEGKGIRAVITAFSQKEAAKAVDQLTNVMRVYRSLDIPLDMLTDQLDDVIRKNNGWHTGINDTASFKEFFAKRSLDIENNDFSFKGRDGIINDNTDEIFDGQTYDLKFSSQLGRADDVLTHYGGHETRNDSAVGAMVNQLNDVMSAYAHQNYTEAALASFNKRAALRTTSAKGNDASERVKFVELFKNLSNQPGKTAEDNDLIALGNTIRRRMSMKDDLTKAMDEIGAQAIDYVFDSFKVKVPQVSITSGLLNAGYYSAFGFFALGQFGMQLSQIGTIAAISPVAGLRAISVSPAVRLVLNNGHTVGKTRVGKLLGMNEEQSLEFFRYLDSVGRLDVENDAIQKSLGPGFQYSGYAGQSHLPSAIAEGLEAVGKIGKGTMKAGTLPFREGERMSRLVSQTTAYLERLKLKPGEYGYGDRWYTDEALQWLSSREQALTFDMSTGAKGALQTGLARLPAQWLTYPFRAMEAVVIGRDLTDHERIRMGLMLMAQGGMSGMFMDNWADDVNEWLGVTPSSAVAAFVKRGLYDGINTAFLSMFTDEQVATAMGSRLGVLGAFRDLGRKLNDDSAFEALGGPSVEITYGAVKALWNASGDLMSGNYNLALADVERFMRTPSGVDSVWKGLGALRHGTYQSKTGTQLPLPFNTTEAWLTMAGITTDKQVTLYENSNAMYRNSKGVRAFKKQVTQDYVNALDYLRRNPSDVEGFKRLITQVQVSIAESGWSHADQWRISQGLHEKDPQMALYKTYKFLVEQGHQASAANLLTLKEGN